MMDKQAIGGYVVGSALTGMVAMIIFGNGLDKVSGFLNKGNPRFEFKEFLSIYSVHFNLLCLKLKHREKILR